MMSTFSCICFLSLDPRNSWPCVLSIQIQGPFQRHRLPSSWPHYFFVQTVKRTLLSLRTVLFAKSRILKKEMLCGQGSFISLPFSPHSFFSADNYFFLESQRLTLSVCDQGSTCPTLRTESRRKGDQHWKLLTGDYGRTQPRKDSVQTELYLKTHVYYSAWAELLLYLSPAFGEREPRWLFHLSSVSWQLSNTKGLFTCPQCLDNSQIQRDLGQHGPTAAGS